MQGTVGSGGHCANAGSVGYARYSPCLLCAVKSEHARHGRAGVREEANRTADARADSDAGEENARGDHHPERPRREQELAHRGQKEEEDVPPERRRAASRSAGRAHSFNVLAYLHRPW
jgi:hypothetical protein